MNFNTLYMEMKQGIKSYIAHGICALLLFRVLGDSHITELFKKYSFLTYQTSEINARPAFP